MEPVLIPLWPDACKALGIGRTLGFELAASGELDTVTLGRKRMVAPETLRRYAERLHAQQQRPQPLPAA